MGGSARTADPAHHVARRHEEVVGRGTRLAVVLLAVSLTTVSARVVAEPGNESQGTTHNVSTPDLQTRSTLSDLGALALLLSGLVALNYARHRTPGRRSGDSQPSRPQASSAQRHGTASSGWQHDRGDHRPRRLPAQHDRRDNERGRECAGSEHRRAQNTNSAGNAPS